MISPKKKKTASTASKRSKAQTPRPPQSPQAHKRHFPSPKRGQQLLNVPELPLDLGGESAAPAKPLPRRAITPILGIHLVEGSSFVYLPDEEEEAAMEEGTTEAAGFLKYVDSHSMPTLPLKDGSDNKIEKPERGSFLKKVFRK